MEAQRRTALRGAAPAAATPGTDKSRRAQRKPPRSYYRARYYDPTTGRFLSEDPIRFRSGPNFYPYTRNRPTRFRDPSGLIHQEPDGRLHDDGAGGLEVLCQKGRNIQQDIGMLQQSIAVRFLEIVREGDNADLGHINRLVFETITLARCRDMCKDQPKPQPEPAPDGVDDHNWWQYIKRQMINNLPKVFPWVG